MFKYLLSFFILGTFGPHVWSDNNHFVFDFETTKILVKKENSIWELRAKAVWNPLDVDSADPASAPNRLQGTINPLFHQKISELVTLGGCYVYKGEGLFEEDPIQEHRICQDLIFKFFTPFSKVSHRFRLEERWVFRHNQKNWDYRTRLRYRLSHRHTLWPQAEQNRGVSFHVFDEVFFGITGSNQMIQANWLHAGLVFEFDEERELEVGATIETSARPGTTEVQNLILLELDWSW